MTSPVYILICMFVSFYIRHIYTGHMHSFFSQKWYTDCKCHFWFTSTECSVLVPSGCLTWICDQQWSFCRGCEASASPVTVVHAFVTSGIDYCNSLLYGISDYNINRLQWIQNSAARIVTNTRKYDHITPILQKLHWLPLRFC